MTDPNEQPELWADDQLDVPAADGNDEHPSDKELDALIISSLYAAGAWTFRMTTECPECGGNEYYCPVCGGEL